MKVGYNGLIEEAKERMAGLSKKDPEYMDKKEFYQAMKMCIRDSCTSPKVS